MPKYLFQNCIEAGISTRCIEEKFDAAMKSVEARRRKVEANGYAAGAFVLANNNSSFLKWGRRAQVLGVTFFLLLPNLFVMKHGLGWF